MDTRKGAYDTDRTGRCTLIEDSLMVGLNQTTAIAIGEASVCAKHPTPTGCGVVIISAATRTAKRPFGVTPRIVASVGNIVIRFNN